jgi:GNAT superfamily N-acetyltransferase
MGKDVSCYLAHTERGKVHFGKDLPVEAKELVELRRSVGWPVRGDYGVILQEGLFHIVARMDGRLVGFLEVVGSPHGDLLIHDMCVHPDLQRQGVGTVMMEMALEACRGLGPQGVNVLFEEKNRPFFQRFGFRMIGGGYLDGDSL